MNNLKEVMIRIVFLVVALAAIGHGHTFELDNMPSVNEFNVSELNLYNNMVSCVANFKIEFVKCNKQLQKLAANVFRVINENSTLGGIVKCCGIWLARDCWLSHARQNCIDQHVTDVYQLPFKLLPKLDKWCHVYHDQTLVCLLPHYLPFALMLLAICVTIAVLGIVVWRSKTRKKRKQVQPKSYSSTENRPTNNETSVNENLLDQNRNIRTSP